MDESIENGLVLKPLTWPLTTEYTSLVLFIPSILFCLGYIMVIGRVLLHFRLRKAMFIKGLVFLMLVSQAYELWKYVQYFTRIIISCCFGGPRETLEFLTLLLLSSVPSLATLFKFRLLRQREYLVRWRSHGPRTELGNTSYYLNRPLSSELAAHKEPTAPSRRIRSQNTLRPKEQLDQRPPKSA